MTLQSEISEIVAKLTALGESLAKVEDLEAKAATAKANLEATNAFLETTKNELTKASTGLSATQAKNLQEFDENIYTRSRDLANLNAKIAETEEQLRRLKSEERSAMTTHDQILASIESLRKRIA